MKFELSNSFYEEFTLQNNHKFHKFRQKSIGISIIMQKIEDLTRIEPRNSLQCLRYELYATDIDFTISKSKFRNVNWAACKLCHTET